MVPAFLHIGLRLLLQPQIVPSLILVKVQIQKRLSDLSRHTNIFSLLLHLIKIPFLGVRGHSSTMETSKESLCSIEISKRLVKSKNREFL